MPNPIQRLHFFDQQFLRAVDFTTEQDYHRQMLREHNRTLHTAGVAGGLVLTPAGGAVTVSPGTAIDADGEEIVLLEQQTVDLAGHPAGASVHVTIAFRTRTTDPTDETGVTDYTRYTDEPLLETSVAAPADPGRTLILGIALRSGTVVTGIGVGTRKRASVPEADVLRSETAAQVSTRVAKSGDTVTGALTIQGALTASTGAITGGLSLGRDPGAGIDYPYDYESVGVTDPSYNLRLQSPNTVVLHAGGAPRATVGATGGLQVHADPARQIQLTVGAGGNGTLKVRHIDGKSGADDSDDTLYLNWSTGKGVYVGNDLTVAGTLRLNPDAGGVKLIVGSGGNGVLLTRHINGKNWLDDSDDTLFLNSHNGKSVYVGSDLTVVGALRVAGDAAATVRMIVGSGANGRLMVRHIDGKTPGSDADDDLYLNWSNQKTVQIGSGLVVNGALDFAGDHSDVRYVRLGAMQICWGDVPLPGGPGETQERVWFAAPFVWTPCVMVSLNDTGYGATTPGASVGAFSVANDAFTVLYKSSSNRQGPVTASFVAFGRWR